MSQLSTRRAIYVLITVIVMAAAFLVMTGRSLAAPQVQTPRIVPQSAPTPLFPTMVRIA